jgi:hypothetical protein
MNNCAPSLTPICLALLKELKEFCFDARKIHAFLVRHGFIEDPSQTVTNNTAPDPVGV